MSIDWESIANWIKLRRGDKLPMMVRWTMRGGDFEKIRLAIGKINGPYLGGWEPGDLILWRSERQADDSILLSFRLVENFPEAAGNARFGHEITGPPKSGWTLSWE